MLKNIFPPIGLRIIKSVVGVFLCFLIDMLRGGNGIVFYSLLAVLWCMQDYVSETKAKAVQRTIGTVCGATYGLLALLLFQAIEPIDLQWGNITAEHITNLLRAVIISLFVMIVIYTTVVLKKKQASYFSCVVFLSIVVNHLSDANPFLFVWNRFLDTMIGIAIGVGVNCFSLARRKNKNYLFVSGVDETLLNDNDNMTDYSRVELNRMIEDGAKFTLSTMRTPASIMESLGGIKLKLPAVVMDGAALYNFAQNRYERVYVIGKEQSQRIARFFLHHQVPFFSNVIIDDTLLIYYQETENVVYQSLVETMRQSPYRNYVKRSLPPDEAVVYFMILDKTECVQNLYEKMMAKKQEAEYEFPQNMKVLMYPSTKYLGYSYIKVYSHNAVKENMLDYLQEKIECEKIITFGTIPGRYTHVVSPGDSNRVIKMMKKEYEPFWFVRSSK